MMILRLSQQSTWSNGPPATGLAGDHDDDAIRVGEKRYPGDDVDDKMIMLR